MPLRLRHIGLSTTVAAVITDGGLAVWDAAAGAWVGAAVCSAFMVAVLYGNRRWLPLLWRWRRPAYRLYRDVERLIEGMNPALCYHAGDAHLVRSPCAVPAVARVEGGKLPCSDWPGVETWEIFTLSLWPPMVRYTVSSVITGLNEAGEPEALSVLECHPELEPARCTQALEGLVEQLRHATPR